MITEELTETRTLAIVNGKVAETEENAFAYYENFFEHCFNDTYSYHREMQRILKNLEIGAKAGNELAGAILGKAVLISFLRRQVVADGLSYLTRAMKKGVRGAAVELVWWYFDRMTEYDLEDFENTDVGLGDCYESTKEFPRVEFPEDDDECINRMLDASVYAIEQGDFDEIESELARVLTTIEGVEPDLLNRIWRAIESASEKAVSDEMATFASLLLSGLTLYSDPQLAHRVLKRGVEQNHPRSLGALGGLLLNGEFEPIKKDEAKGFEYLTRAVELGDLVAMASLARCYLDGTGVEKDEARGGQLMFDAAECGNDDAMVYVGCNLVEAGRAHGDNKAIKRGCEYIRDAAEEDDFLPAWEAMLKYHNEGVGPFKTNKFARAARAALKRYPDPE